MSSLDSVKVNPQSEIQILFDNGEVESSEDPPMEEWSSLYVMIPEANLKHLQYDQGLYEPGSGNICTKYIPLSASSVLRHPYYKYPALVDPGIIDALLLPETEIKYPDDGQELYLSLCNQCNLCPIKLFYRQLLEDKINLSYYGIHPMAFRVMALSLKFNKFVTLLDLTDNWISLDGCFHLGEMLRENITLKELNLYGCKIGPEGARRLFANLHVNRSLKKLNLSKNELGDTGVEFLAKAIFFGAGVVEIVLTKNGLTGKTALALNEALEVHNKLTHLDLSWNSIFAPIAFNSLCKRLSENDVIQELNFSWNSLAGPRIGNGLMILLENRNIKNINLSNNNLSSSVIEPIRVSLRKAVGLITLDLSSNHFTPNDALVLLSCLRVRRVKLRNLHLDNIVVNDEFIKQLNDILLLRFRKNTVVTYGYVQKCFIPRNVDMRELILNRIECLCKGTKKKRINFALIIQELYHLNKDPMNLKQFTTELQSRGAKFNNDLLDGLCSVFSGPKSKTAKFIDLKSLVDYLERKWPDRILPPEAFIVPTEPVPTVAETKQSRPKGKQVNKKK